MPNWQRQHAPRGTKGVKANLIVQGGAGHRSVEHAFDSHGQLHELQELANPAEVEWVYDVTCLGRTMIVTYEKWKLPPATATVQADVLTENCNSA